MHPNGSNTSVQDGIYKLCQKITRLSHDDVTPIFQVSLNTLGSKISCPYESDEFEVGNKIRKKLAKQKRVGDAAIVSDLLRKLQAQFIYQDENTFYHGVLGHGITSTPFPQDQTTLLHPGSASSSRTTASSSGISSVSRTRSDQSSFEPVSLAPSAFRTPGPLPPEVGNNATAQRLLGILQRQDAGGSHIQPAAKQKLRQTTTTTATRGASQTNTAYEIPESQLLREVLYVFQGIKGQLLKLDTEKDGFRLDNKVGIPRAARQIIHRLVEIGWMFSKIRRYADLRSADRALGLVGQSFCAALHEELTEYYRLLAVLEAQVQQQEDHVAQDPSSKLTLRRLAVWTCEPMVRLRSLAAIVDVCEGKKGGALASVVFAYLQHGDPTVRALMRHTLTLVAQPIFTTITRWIYDGLLDDVFYEFFVSADPAKKDDSLWHDKYIINKNMLPSFITEGQAKKILLIGKSINFLRQICEDRTIIRGRDVIKAVETHDVESIFLQDNDGRFELMINTVYKETSLHLLEILHVKYKFLDHLKALRRYLLMGQGDFIRHLMDLLEEDLAKPATTLFVHNLTGILETAIRGTNAQFDDADILKRLDVRLLEVSAGDTGWDVFSLDYHVDGPIRTVFTAEIMIMYLRAFNFLWRAKRMEYTLSIIWRDMMAMRKPLRALPELGSVLHKCHVQCNEMVYFIQQLQYYVNFEVLECSWSELLRKVSEAADFDQIISAHQEFLNMIIARLLVNESSSSILKQLRTVFDLVISFEAIQSDLYRNAKDELQAREIYESMVKQREAKGDWGTTERDEEFNAVRLENFQLSVEKSEQKLRVLSKTYQTQVQDFLVMLVGHSDASLRCLSFRLDFNEYYKKREPKLQKSPAHALRARRRNASNASEQ